MFFGSCTCKGESKGTYATVPDALYAPNMMVIALWSFLQLLDQCWPAKVTSYRNNSDWSWGFYFPGCGVPVTVAQRHGNTFLVATSEVKKLLTAARGSALAMSAMTANNTMF